MSPPDSRAVVPVIGIVALVAVTVVLAALVGASAFALADPSVPPTAFVDADPPVATAASPGDDQRVTIRHDRGDSIPAEEIELVVSLPEYDRETRLVGLPTAGALPAESVDGDDIVDRRENRLVGPAFEGGEWDSGERIGFRIKSYRDDGVSLAPGDTVVVRIVHVPTGSMLADIEIPVR